MSRMFVVVAALLVPTLAAAQGFAGSWIYPTPNGQLTLTLSERGNRVTGSLSGNGTSLAFEGQAVQGRLSGFARNAQGAVQLAGAVQGGGLALTLSELGPNGQPDPAQARQLVFTRADGGAQGAAPPVSAAPMGVRSGAGAADPFVGTFAGADLSLTLQRAPGGYSGEAQSAGGHYPVQARLVNGILQGTYVQDGMQRGFQAQVQGDMMQLAADGSVFMLQRQGAAVAGGGAMGQPMRQGGAPPAGGQAGGAIASTPQDRQIAQLLLRSAWCSFSYSQISGTTSTSRVAFSPDGRWRMGSQRESQSSNQYGQVYGSSSGGDQGVWRVQNGALLMSSDGMQWETLPLNITQNSSGYPIVNAGGREYSMCN